jgi:phage-related protein
VAAAGVQPAWHSRRVARTQAIYDRDARGGEPVDDFINALPGKQAARIDDHVEEHLNGKRPSDPPPEFPVSSQVCGELRELRVRSADRRYRIFYQRSGNLLVLLHAFEKTTGSIAHSDIELAKHAGRMRPATAREALTVVVGPLHAAHIAAQTKSDEFGPMQPSGELAGGCRLFVRYGRWGLGVGCGCFAADARRC